MAQQGVIKDIVITPVAFHGMPLLNSFGVHESYALRDGMGGMVTTASVADKVFSPFEVACLDGKKAGIPVNELLGGRVRDNVQFTAYLF